MEGLLFCYNGGSRELRKIIISLLKSGYASMIQKINYVQKFGLKGNVVEKCEIKYIIIYTDDESKLLNLLSKSFPQVERIEIK